MITTLSRVFKYGMNDFKRNGWLSTAAIAIVFLSLVGFGGLIIFNSLANLVLNDVQDKIDISVYFKVDAPEDSILSLQNSLESMKEVKQVDYVSRDQALAQFKSQHQGDQTVSQAINDLGSNPLSASLNIKATQLNRFQSIDSSLILIV